MLVTFIIEYKHLPWLHNLLSLTRACVIVTLEILLFNGDVFLTFGCYLTINI